ncbi:MAG: hypothetical protein MJ115_02690 [Clostridia bacterium]|nr:hypothetical protein [Clostridia bacterium]
MASIEELLDEMEDILSDAKGKSFSSKKTVDIDALKIVIDDLRNNFPEEVKQAQILASERREIISRANREADAAVADAKIICRDLLASAEQRSKDMDTATARRTEELIRAAQQKSQQTINAAKEEAAKAASREAIVVEARAQADIAKAEADKYLEEAKKEAKRILDDAEFKSKEMIETSEARARDLKLKASAYVNDIVTDAEYRISRSHAEIKELQKSMSGASKKAAKASKPQQQRKPQQRREREYVESNFSDPQVISHQSIIDIPLEDDFNSFLDRDLRDDPPLHEKSNYNIEL